MKNNISNFITAMALQFRAEFEIIWANTKVGTPERIESYNVMNRNLDSFIVECIHHFKDFNEAEFRDIVRK